MRSTGITWERKSLEPHPRPTHSGSTVEQNPQVTYMHIELRSTALEDGEGNGTPLQYSCLENPMDGGAWWAAVHGVAKSWT